MYCRNTVKIQKEYFTANLMVFSAFCQMQPRNFDWTNLYIASKCLIPTMIATEKSRDPWWEKSSKIVLKEGDQQYVDDIWALGFAMRSAKTDGKTVVNITNIIS